MSKISSIFTLFLVLAGIMILGVWSNIYAYGQQLSSPALPPSTTSSVSKSISPELKAIMCDPSNPDLKVVNTTEAHVCGIAKTVKPGLPQTSPVASSPNPAITNLKSTAIKPAATTTTTTATGVTIPQKPQQITATKNGVSPSTVYVTWATIDSLSNPSNTLPSTIAPQISAVNRQQQLPLFPITRVNSTTAGQNHTFTAISPVASTSDQLVYLGYHGNSKSSHGNGDSNHGDNHDSKGSSTRSTSDSSPTQKNSKPFTPPRIKVVSTDFDSTPKTATKVDTKNDPKPPKVHNIKTTTDDSSIVKKKTTIRTNDKISSEDKNSASTESSSHHATDTDSSLKKKRIKSYNGNSKGNDDGSDAISSSKSSSNIEDDIPSVIVKSFNSRHSADSDNSKSSSIDDHIPSVIVKSFNSKHSRGDSFFDGDKFFSDEGDDGF